MKNKGVYMKDEEKEIQNVFTGSRGQAYDIYIGDIGVPEEFYDILFVINTATENDEIILHINSGGGMLSTTVQLANAIKKCRGQVTGSFEGFCASGATIIFLACNSWEIQPDGIFMIHAPSGYSEGKHTEVIDKALFDRKWTEAYYQSIYKDFLTTVEIKSVLAGKDIWLTSEEVAVRIRKTATARTKGGR